MVQNLAYSLLTICGALQMALLSTSCRDTCGVLSSLWLTWTLGVWTSGSLPHIELVFVRSSHPSFSPLELDRCHGTY